MLDELDATIGLDRLKALHVNDSQVELGSNRDRHANVGEGLIGERMSAFLGRPRLQGLPAVLETPGHDGKGADAPCMQAARAPLARGPRQLTMRVAVVDPQAFTLPYDDELCRALAARRRRGRAAHGALHARRGARRRAATRAARSSARRSPA